MDYLDLREVFNKARATYYPPHRPYDCAIALLPGASPHRGRFSPYHFLKQIYGKVHQ